MQGTRRAQGRGSWGSWSSGADLQTTLRLEGRDSRACGSWWVRTSADPTGSCSESLGIRPQHSVRVPGMGFSGHGEEAFVLSLLAFLSLSWDSPSQEMA